MSRGSMFVDIEDVTPETLERAQGWAISDFRIPISGRQGCSSLMYEAVFEPGDVHHKHRLACEEMYYIKRGRALAGVGDERVELGDGDYQLIFIPWHWHDEYRTDPLSRPSKCSSRLFAATVRNFKGSGMFSWKRWLMANKFSVPCWLCVRMNAAIPGVCAILWKYRAAMNVLHPGCRAFKINARTRPVSRSCASSRAWISSCTRLRTSGTSPPGFGRIFRQFSA